VEQGRLWKPGYKTASALNGYSTIGKGRGKQTVHAVRDEKFGNTKFLTLEN
jgi:hypothetical protein